jgi:hypothetical protein
MPNSVNVKRLGIQIGTGKTEGIALLSLPAIYSKPIYLNQTISA